MDGLRRVFQQIQQYLLQLVTDAGHPVNLRVEITDNFDSTEIEAFDQREVITGDFQCLVDQHPQLTFGQLTVAEPGKAEHMADDLRCTRACLLNAIEQLRYFASLQVLVHRLQQNTGFVGSFSVALQVGGETSADVLRVVQDSP